MFPQGDRGEPGLPGDRGEKGEKVEAVIICHSCPTDYFFPSQSPVVVLLSLICRILLYRNFCLCSHVLKCYLPLQGFRGLPGRIGSPGLDGEMVRPQLAFDFMSMSSEEILSVI